MIIIRNDDISAATDIRQVHEMYDICFRNRIPICFGVTPEQKCTGGDLRTVVPRGLLVNNHDLMKWLKKKSSTNEICLHGITHAKGENPSLASIRKSISELDMNIGTYISPFNRIDKSLAGNLLSSHINLSSGFYDFYQNRPFLLRQKLFVGETDGLFLSDECIFGEKTGVAGRSLGLAKKRYYVHKMMNKPFILVNHHWDMRASDIKLWKEFIIWCLHKKIEFTTFRSCPGAFQGGMKSPESA